MTSRNLYLAFTFVTITNDSSEIYIEVENTHICKIYINSVGEWRIVDMATAHIFEFLLKDFM